MRGLDGAPILVEDAVVLSDQVQGYIRRLGEEIQAHRRSIERGWRRRRLEAGMKPGDPQLRALAAINPGSSAELLARGKLHEYFENVEYQGRRLAKLEVGPAEVVASLREYEEALLPVLEQRFGRDASNYVWSLEHLYFCIMLTLNTAYFQVRDLEARAFYEVFQDELESQGVDQLLRRVLDSLMRAFHAEGGGVLLLRPGGRLELKASRGLEPELARHFSGPVGKGFAGRIARTGRAKIILDVRRDALTRSSDICRVFRTLWGVPLVVKGRVTGVLHLNFAREYACLPREMRLLEAVAERCALALEKAQLMEALADREKQIRKMSEHMLKVEEQERRRISRELHDEVGQAMLVVRLYLEMLHQELRSRAPQLLTKVSEALAVIDGTIRDMRRLIAALSPTVLEQLGLEAALRQFVTNFGRSFPVHVRLKLRRLGRLPQDAEIMLYRLVQECFTNVIKHSRAENVLLAVHRSNGRVHLRVEDDGIGFDPDRAVQKRGSFGLAGMGERVALLGGQMEIKSRPKEGARISIQIPI
jgi:signal transduction histidine kinase